MCIAIISRPLQICIMCLGCAWLQSPDQYQSLVCVKDGYGYNIQIITSFIYVHNIQTITNLYLRTISRQLSIFILSLGCVWLQSLDHYQSLFFVKDWFGYQSLLCVQSPDHYQSVLCVQSPDHYQSLFCCLGWVWRLSPDHNQSVFCV